LARARDRRPCRIPSTGPTRRATRGSSQSEISLFLQLVVSFPSSDPFRVHWPHQGANSAAGPCKSQAFCARKQRECRCYFLREAGFSLHVLDPLPARLAGPMRGWAFAHRLPACSRPSLALWSHTALFHPLQLPVCCRAWRHRPTPDFEPESPRPCALSPRRATGAVEFSEKHPPRSRLRRRAFPVPSGLVRRHVDPSIAGSPPSAQARAPPRRSFADHPLHG
jgi:hypothetical protein